LHQIYASNSGKCTCLALYWICCCYHRPSVLVQSAYKPGYMHTLEMPVQIKCLQHVYHLNVMLLLLDGNQTTNIISCQQSLEAGLAGAGPLMSASVAHQAAGLTSTCDEQHSLHSQVCTCHAHVHKQFNIVNILHGASCFCSCVCCWRDTCKSVLFCYESILAIKSKSQSISKEPFPAR